MSGAFDIMIAAHAEALGATLVTNDMAVKNLKIDGSSAGRSLYALTQRFTPGIGLRRGDFPSTARACAETSEVTNQRSFLTFGLAELEQP